jgi:hypothetical protein
MFRKESAPLGQTHTQWLQSMQNSSALLVATGKEPFSFITITLAGHTSTQIPSRLHLLSSMVIKFIMLYLVKSMYSVIGRADQGFAPFSKVTAHKEKF